MSMTRSKVAVALVLAGGCVTSASAQDVYRYEFNMVLIENNMFGSAHVGVFNTMPLGTTGRVFVEVEDTVVASTGNTDRNYRVLDVGVSAGGFSVGGFSSVYPTSGIPGSLGIGNESPGLGNPSHSDYFVAPLFLEPSELDNLSTLVLFDTDYVNGEHVFLDSVDLPDKMNLNVVDAVRRIFQVSSSQTNERAYFELTGIETIITPAPGTAALLALGGIVAVRRRQ